MPGQVKYDQDTLALIEYALARLEDLFAAAGVHVDLRRGDPVEVGQPLLFLHAQTRGELDYALDYARSAGEIVQVLR